MRTSTTTHEAAASRSPPRSASPSWASARARAAPSAASRPARPPRVTSPGGAGPRTSQRRQATSQRSTRSTRTSTSSSSRSRSTPTTRCSARPSPRATAPTSSTSPPAPPTAASRPTQGGAIDLTAAVEEALGATGRTSSPRGRRRPHRRRQARRRCPPEPSTRAASGSTRTSSTEYGLDAADHARRVEGRLRDARDRRPAGCFVQGAGQWAFDMDTFQAIANNIEPGRRTSRRRQGEIAVDRPGARRGDGRSGRASSTTGSCRRAPSACSSTRTPTTQFMSGEVRDGHDGHLVHPVRRQDSMVAAMEAAGVAEPEPFTDDRRSSSPTWRARATPGRCSATPTTASP